MTDFNKTTYFYRHKFKRKEATFNKAGLLPSYFAPMIGEKKEVMIAELGAGPINTIGNEWPGTKVIIYASDILQPEYQKFWEESGKTPIVPVSHEDMEELSYPDEMFDIVHCVNAIDHTPNLHRAIEELKRVCKKGGWVYLRHAHGQKTKYGGMHYHDFETISLPEFTTHQEETPRGWLTVSTWQKI